MKNRDITLFPLRNLRPNTRNARTHPKKQIKQIINSIQRFGWTYPILADENGTILAGYGRYLAALELGLAKIPVMTLADLSEVEKRALALADNKIAANAGWDRKLLAEELGELAQLLPECNLDLEITGFEPAEIDGLLGDLVDPELDPADEVPAPPKTAITKFGDLWELGAHKLLCGDAQSAKAVRRLMGAESATMVITDPPYNLPIKQVQGRGRIKHADFAQGAGEMSRAQFIDFLRAVLSLAAKYSVDGAIHFIFIDWRHIHELLAAGSAVYSELENIAVWAKTNAGQGSFYRSQHEFVCVYRSGDSPHINNIELGRHGRNRSNLWTYPGVNTFRAGRLDDLAMHPTVKPVGLVADAMRDCSRRGDIVLDLFLGSGTTIIAAERVGRRAFGVEIDPLYVDVVVRRWQAYTRRDVLLQGSGQTFEEIAAASGKPELRREKGWASGPPCAEGEPELGRNLQRRLQQAP